MHPKTMMMFSRRMVRTPNPLSLTSRRRPSKSQHAVGDEWWEHSIHWDYYFPAANLIQGWTFDALGDIKFHKYLDLGFTWDDPIEAKLWGHNEIGQWFVCRWTKDWGPELHEWEFQGCVYQEGGPSHPHLQPKGLGFYQQPKMMPSRGELAIGAQVQQNPLPSGPWSQPPFACIDCIEICLPMPTPNDPDAMKCVKVDNLHPHAPRALFIRSGDGSTRPLDPRSPAAATLLAYAASKTRTQAQPSLMRRLLNPASLLFSRGG